MILPLKTDTPAANGHENVSEPLRTIRIVLADDHAMVREGLRAVLEGYNDVQVIGEAKNGEEAVLLVDNLRPSVVIMDINMPMLNGIEATILIKSRHPEVRVIGLSVNADGSNEDAMKQAGAEVLLTKETAVDELYHAIHTALKEKAAKT
jgi:DNA-binding NarL/FixJ family response regulator